MLPSDGDINRSLPPRATGDFFSHLHPHQATFLLSPARPGKTAPPPPLLSPVPKEGCGWEGTSLPGCQLPGLEGVAILSSSFFSLDLLAFSFSFSFSFCKFNRIALHIVLLPASVSGSKISLGTGQYADGKYTKRRLLCQFLSAAHRFSRRHLFYGVFIFIYTYIMPGLFASFYALDRSSRMSKRPASTPSLPLPFSFL